jgi:flagellar hook-associated protein 1 FlgK
MSLSASMNTAVSGLTASSQATEIVSSNIANAETEGYGARSLELSTSSTTSGVVVSGVSRASDESLLAERRVSEAEEGAATVTLDYYSGVEDILGAAEDSTSLTGRLDELEASLIEAQANPDSTASLDSVVTAADSAADLLNEASDEVQGAREEADHAIDEQVDLLNTTLDSLAALNDDIALYTAQGRDTSALEDQRQVLTDSISDIVPLREVKDENGQVSLYTTGGVTLVEGSYSAEIGFDSTLTITADMTVESGALSGLTVDGREVSTDQDGGFAGGTLAANFEVRDELAPATQADLDAVARDLIARFSEADTTLAEGEAGLFTDDGEAFDESSETGLAGRISVNSAVDPDQGGELWRLRSGIGAEEEGAAGDTSLLTAMAESMSESRLAESGSFEGSSQTASGMASELMSSVSNERISAESDASYATSRADSLRDTEAEQAIDTDVELMNLMLIEQAYAANAEVIAAIDEMYQVILEMV